MKEPREIDPGQATTRGVLRVVGPAVLGLGALLTAVGMISFFSAFGGMEPPRYFWCAFLGLPLLALGGALTQAGYVGSILRYFSGQVAPVQKDTFNYLAEGTSGGVRTLAESVGQGLAAGMGRGAVATETTACPRCAASNPSAANFCSRCGAGLQVEERTCPGCGAEVGSSARFCSRCGHGLA